MASVTITLDHICTGGNHLQFVVTGDRSATINTQADQVLAAFDEGEEEAFIKALVKLAKIGRTNAQVRALFQAGVTVSI